MNNIEDFKNKIQECINQSKKINKDCNAFVTIIDNAKNDNIGVLSGIPYNAKDLFSTKGILTTGSSKSLENYIPVFDATVIERLNNAGACLISKSACDEFGLGGTGTTCHTGAVKNPFDNTRIAGGSSAGAAVSVATSSSAFALGTDTGDSVRKPAAYCGIVGYKPTYGILSRYGVLPFASSLDTVGLFTKNVSDAAKITDVIKGKDPKDMTSIELGYNICDEISKDVKGKKLFYIKELCEIESYDNPSEELKHIISKFHKTLDIAKSLGIEVEGINIDTSLLDAIYPTYMVISCAEATSNLSMYNGILYGKRASGTKINEMIKNFRTDNFSPLIKRRLVIGSYVLAKENQEKYYLNACRVRRMIINLFNDLFKKYDACITIASGKIAPLINEASDVFTREAVLENHMAIGNFGGYPSITIPNGKYNNMPIGINITGKIKDDGKILNIANALEKAGINND